VKLLIDQDMHSGTAALLRDLGHDAMNLLETGLSRSPDDVVIEFAVSEGRVIATLDADYHRIVATQSRSTPSVIFLRVRTPTADVADDLIHTACSQFEPQLLAGRLLTCEASKMRTRLLPMRRDQAG